MNIIQRITKIIRSHKPTELLPVGGEMMAELNKHTATLDERIELLKATIACSNIDATSWATLHRQVETKIGLEKDERKQQSLLRLKSIAENNNREAADNKESYAGKLEELQEIRSRVLQAVSMIEIENNVRSVTSMQKGIQGMEHQVSNLEIETREIRRLLHATDGLMEITQ
jgi:hypothetical protein